MIRCKSYAWQGSSWRPSACWADVIATRPQVPCETNQIKKEAAEDKPFVTFANHVCCNLCIWSGSEIWRHRGVGRRRLLAGGGLLSGGVGRRRCRRCRQIRRRRLASGDVGRRWHRHSSMQSAVKETKQIVCKQRDSSSQPSDLESDALLLRHAASEQWRLEGCMNGHCDFKHQLPRVASGVGRCHVAVASGFAVGQWLQGEWTRSLLMRREGGIMRVASATGVGHIGWWHWSAGGIGQVPSAQPSLFRGLARI